jgi:transcription-repair coupling factor (superfamily II helicase)
MAEFPVRIEAMSRFRTEKEQETILGAIASGAVDIAIGTHRLLQDDVVFRDLGLLIIDEEQRFGVAHKEKLKGMRENVDVLSMSATPIPRTLHLAMAGLRDLSLIQTPPRDRLPVATHVVRWSDSMIEDALRRELDRGGQVYVVHDRVESIEPVAGRIRRLAPDASVEIAHGQMHGHELERVMERFIRGDTQVLVSTSIIENGLDVPNANTLIVHRAENFGLSQLYQIRGRVGRSHHRAYCYLVVPDDVTDDAERRLKILEHYTELGSGYAVAMKDLELRGAGNLLGAEQSGFVHAVGLDTYSRLLEKTIERLKATQEGRPTYPTPEVSTRGAALIPDDYIADASQKLQLYRRLSRITSAHEAVDLRAEVRDRFGPPPAEVANLIGAAALRLLGSRLGLERVLLSDDAARLTFREDVMPRLTLLQKAFVDRQLAVEVRRALPLSIVVRNVGAEPVIDVVVAALSEVAEAAA